MTKHKVDISDSASRHEVDWCNALSLIDILHPAVIDDGQKTY